MAVVVATRLEGRGWAGTRAALRLSNQVVGQLASCPGFLGGRVLVDRRRVLWTLTVWADRASLSAFRELHAPVAERGDEVARTMQMTAWQQDGGVVPSWRDVGGRWTAVRSPARGASRPVQPARQSTAA